MLLRMKVLVVACLCVPAVVGFPSSTTTNTKTEYNTPSISSTPSSSTTSTKRNASASKWRPILPSHPSYRVIKVPITLSKTSTFVAESNDIPAETLLLFRAPSATTKEARQLEYYSDSSEVVVPAHVPQLLHKVPFFETLDHGKLMSALQMRRELVGLPMLALKSSRPYFPFFRY